MKWMCNGIIIFLQWLLGSIHCSQTLVNCFTRADKDSSSNVIIPAGGVPCILDREILNISDDQIQSTSGVKCKRVIYGELDKIKIKKNANECAIVNAVVKYKSQFPSLTKSTARSWLKKVPFPAWNKRAEFKSSFICKGRTASLFIWGAWQNFGKLLCKYLYANDRWNY